MRRLTNNAFPDCCGINVLANFGSRSTSVNGNLPISPADRETYSLDVKEWIRDLKRVGLGLIALNSLQVEAGIGDLLIAEGMQKIVDPFFHPGHSRHITLYGYVSYPEKQQIEAKTEPKPEVKPEVKDVEFKPRTGLFSKPAGTAKKRLVRRKSLSMTRGTRTPIDLIGDKC